MPKRIRRDHGNTELRGAKAFRARKQHECTMCGVPIFPKEVYVRISEVRTAVCSFHFSITDIVETDK